MELDLRTAYMFVGKESESGDLKEMIGWPISSFKEFNQLTGKSLEPEAIFVEGIGEYPAEITDCFQDKSRLIESIHEKITSQNSYLDLVLGEGINLVVQFGGRSKIVRSEQYKGINLICAGKNSVKRSARFVNYLNNSQEDQFGSLNGNSYSLCAPAIEGMITPDSALISALVINYSIQDVVPLALQDC